MTFQEEDEVSRRETLDREADLHHAYQFGQAMVRENDPSIREEFVQIFGVDPEAECEFEKGVNDEKFKSSKVSRRETSN